MKRIVKTNEMPGMDSNLDERLSMLCVTIEDAFIANGAEAGRDYTHRDLMGLAIQIVCAHGSSGAADLSYIAAIPNSSPHAYRK